MERRKRTRVFLGIILILVGTWFLAAQWFPALKIWESFEFSWPWYVIGSAILLLLLGLLTGEPDMLVPATIVGGVGVLLYWQNETGNWASWAYAWTLIPGFVGIGLILSGLLKGGKRSDLKDGFNLILLSMFLFVIFAAIFGQMEWVSVVGAVLLILVGLSLLLRPLFRRKESNPEKIV